jgi:Mn-dependent DtxR family transcriptional regulator
MKVHPSYTNIVRLLVERGDRTPVEMLAMKTDTTASVVLYMLQKLEQLKVVILDPDKKYVRINPGNIPVLTMEQVYALAD